MPYTTRSDALEVSCPFCGANPGDKCIGARDKVRESVHRERLNDAAQTLAHHELRTLRVQGDRLIDAEGAVIGRLLGLELDLQLESPERFEGNLRRGEGEADVDVASKSSKKNSSKGSAEGPEQQALLPDPVDEVWEHYVKTLNRPKARLVPKVRRWIADAIKATSVEECKLAITGLSVSDWHKTGGFVGIEYALKPKQDETAEGRIAMMAAKAPAQTSGGIMRGEDAALTVPPGVRVTVRHLMTLVVPMYRRPDDENARVTAESAIRELAKMHLAPAEYEENGRKRMGWRRV